MTSRELGDRVTMRCLVVVAVAASVVASCGSGDVLVHSQAAQQVGPTRESDCPVKYLTLATVTEAYWAETGGPPASEGELVVAGLLGDEVDDFDLLIGDNDVEVVAVDFCSGFEPT